MKRFFFDRSFGVFELSFDEWPYLEHTHNFYELIFVKEGCGKHLLNESTFDYQKGDVFLMTPKDSHLFEIKDRTTFMYVKFTDQVFSNYSRDDSSSFWIEKLNNLLEYSNIIPENILKDKKDHKNIFILIDMLYEEFQDIQSSSASCTVELFKALVLLISRNLTSKYISQSHRIERDNLHEILRFIRQNLHDNNKLKLSYLAKKFNKSSPYLGKYIKKQSGIGLKEMIIRTRLRAAEQLLAQSNHTINEIAEKVGFYDVSHMTKTVKKYNFLKKNI